MSRFLCFSETQNQSFEICDVIIGIATYWKLRLYLFLLNPLIKMKLCQIIVCSMTNISNIFLA